MDRRFLESDSSLFDKIPAALFRIRFDGARFIFTDANAGGHLLTQGKVADLFGRDVFDIWKKANNRHLAENTKRAFESGERIEETFWHTFVSDKQRRYVNAHYVPLGGKEVLLCINDLTDEKYRAEQLTHLESRYRALFERSDTGLLEGLPTKFFDCNNQIARIFGYSKHEFLKLKEPLSNSTRALASRRDHWRGALPPTCVGLSRRGNEASELVWRPLRAGPVGRNCVVVPLGKGLTIPCA
jgi:PAS domain-containing protein